MNFARGSEQVYMYLNMVLNNNKTKVKITVVWTITMKHINIGTIFFLKSAIFVVIFLFRHCIVDINTVLERLNFIRVKINEHKVQIKVR